MEKKIENTIPVLPVKNLKKSFEFYIDTLGFKSDFAGHVIGSVSRDGCSILLKESHEPTDPVWVWMGLQDDSLFNEYKEKGVKVFQEPQNHQWAYEMKFEDIDGNIVWIGTEARKDIPFEGE
jgi:predicted lactoylglutathione lyase